jgi:tetratricopeptide (TPR) repeat protein
MPDSINKVLESGYRLQSEGKIEDALQLINDFEEKMNVTPTEALRLKLFKGLMNIYKEEFEKNIIIGDQLYQDSLELNKPLLAIESVFIKFIALFAMWRKNESWNDVENCEKLLQSAAQEPSSKFEIAEAYFFFMRGFFYFWEHKYDLAIEHQKKSILVFEKKLRFTDFLAWSLWIIGSSYTAKGELDEALKSFLRSLDLCKGHAFPSKGFIAANNSGISLIYHQQGKLDLAIEYCEKSLQFYETRNIPIFVLEVGLRYDHLIKIALDKKSFKQAQGYLQRYMQYIENYKISEEFSGYLLSKARILRSSTRTRDRAEAERILLQEIEKFDEFVQKGASGIPGEYIEPLIEICEFYLEELSSTNDLAILDDIQPFITRLLKESKRNKSFLLHSQTLLLLGKVSLLQLNMGDARRYLNQSQQIAESHGLQFLARSISNEHDRLLEQLHKWEILEQNKAPISDRMNLALIDDTVDSMQGRLAVNPPELSDESPILLLILSEGGLLTFSYPFVDEWNRDNDIFGSFLSALTTFSDEFFSEGLDRVKFGQQTVLIRSSKSSLICYLFKGQSYKAIQKIDKFASLIHKDASVQKTFDLYKQRGQILELKDFPFLESLIKEIFT